MNLLKLGKNITKYGNKIVSIADDEDTNDEIKTYEVIKNTSGKKFELLPPQEGRSVLYIAGASGSGKSYFTAQFLKKYHKKHPKNKIYVFSEGEHDPAFDDLDIVRIPINDDLLNEPVQYNEFHDCMVVFDDIDSLSGKFKKYVYDLKNKLCKLGRKDEISIIMTSHSPCDGVNTKSDLNESQIIVFFLNNFGRGNKYLCESYIGLNKEGIKKIRNLKTRSVIYLKTYPNIILSDNEVGTLNYYNK
jgi:hypothetical protein